MYTWDAHAYRKGSDNEEKWARELVGKLHLKGDERVLDVGCGDGRVTAEIASLLQHGSVMGIDYSEDMIACAWKTFPPDTYPNLSFQIMDFRGLDFVDEFDVVFSNAALHWVKDQLSVVKKIAAGLKPCGHFITQQGGKGAEEVFTEANQVIAERPWEPYFRGFEFPLAFYGPEEYREWLTIAGLKPLRVELFARSASFDSREGLTRWIQAIWLPYTQRVPEDLRDEFTETIVDRYLVNHPAGPDEKIRVEMIRLEVEAEK